jgi:hypothetical protein
MQVASRRAGPKVGIVVVPTAVLIRGESQVDAEGEEAHAAGVVRGALFRERRQLLERLGGVRPLKRSTRPERSGRA